MSEIYRVWDNLGDTDRSDERILDIAAANGVADAIGIVALEADETWRYRHLGDRAALAMDVATAGPSPSGQDDPISVLVDAAYHGALGRNSPLYLEYHRRLAGVQRAHYRLILPLSEGGRPASGLLVGFSVDDPLQLLLDTIPDTMIVVDGRGNVRSLNRAAELLFQSTMPALIGASLSSLIRLNENRDPLPFEHFGLYPMLEATEMQAVRADGSRIAIEVSIGTTSSGGSNTSLVLVRDVSRRKAEEAAIQHLAYHDSLTGLANRAAFNDLMTRSMARGRRFRTKIALAIIDLDGFKAINDTFGHPFGDQVLRACAERLRARVRGTDTLARLGGDEFALVQTDVVTDDDVMALTGRVIAELRDPITIGDTVVSLAASVGVAIFPDHGDRMATLLERADAALYHAKLSGGGMRLFSMETPARRSPPTG